MGKVICIFTKKEITSLPFDKACAENVIKHLVRFKDPNFADIAAGERKIIEHIIKVIENNSGANRVEVFERLGYFEKVK